MRSHTKGLTASEASSRDRHCHEVALRCWGEIGDERSRHRDLPGAPRKTAPIDSNFDGWHRSTAAAPSTSRVLACRCLRRKSLRLVVDVTIRRIAILIAQ